MNVKIFNVAHGFCAALVADNGNIRMIDCGFNLNPDFRPSVWLADAGYTALNELVIANYDEDHIADLQNVRDAVKVLTLWRNTSITSSQLKAVKEKGGPISDAMKSLLQMIDTYTGGAPQPPTDYKGMELTAYCNSYAEFQDTNNLSFVTFLNYRDVHMIFPGDLEKAGWQALLKRQEFRVELGRVNIFVASHHGRESGYEPTVFDHCHPELVIIPDAEHEDDVQVNTYAGHAKGIKWGQKVKKVFTTWECGTISISQDGSSGPTLSTEFS
jgi:beta-lactamase superfamily II metal-dependent hydrolase